MGQNLATSQQEFDAAYLAAQPQQVQALMQMPYGVDKVVQAQTLIKDGYIIDNTIMLWGWDAWNTTQARILYGYNWVPSAGMPPIQNAPGLPQQGSIPPYDAAIMPAGAILVTIDLNIVATQFPAPK